MYKSAEILTEMEVEIVFVCIGGDLTRSSQAPELKLKLATIVSQLVF